MSAQKDLNQFAKAIDGMSFSEAIDILEKNKKRAATAGSTLTDGVFPKLIQKSIDEIDGLSEDLKKVPGLEETKKRTDEPEEAAAAKEEISRIRRRMMTLLQNDIPRLTNLAHSVSFPDKVYANPEFQRTLQKYLLMISDKVPPTWHVHYDYAGSLRNVYRMTRFMPKDRGEKTLKKLFGTLSFTWRSMNPRSREDHVNDVNKLLYELSSDNRVITNPLYRALVRATHVEHAQAHSAYVRMQDLSEEMVHDKYLPPETKSRLHNIYADGRAEERVAELEELNGKMHQEGKPKSVQKDYDDLINLVKFMAHLPGTDKEKILATTKIPSTLRSSGLPPAVKEILDSAEKGEQVLEQHRKNKGADSLLGLLAWMHKDGIIDEKELHKIIAKVNETNYEEANAILRKGWNRGMEFDFNKKEKKEDDNGQKNIRDELSENFYLRAPRGFSSAVFDEIGTRFAELKDPANAIKNEMSENARKLISNNPKLRRPLAANAGVEDHYRPVFGQTPLLIPTNSPRGSQLLYDGKGFVKITSNGVTAAKPRWKNAEEMYAEAVSARHDLQPIVLSARKIPQVMKRV